MKTFMANKETVKREWFIVDAEGKTLGRLASQVASVLRGKHKPTFTPHVDCGDNVIVINSEKIKLTGNKWDGKLYYRHSGHPGGLKVDTASELMVKHPTRMIELAVRGMLPKGTLGRSQGNKLYVYEGSEHKQTAQQPKVLEIKA